MNEWRPDLFAYLDYRAWMRDAYEAGKAHISAFSFRYLARRAGFSSPSFIKLVMDGQRNLSVDGAQRVAKASSVSPRAVRSSRTRSAIRRLMSGPVGVADSVMVDG